jgi:hypothetical protein
MRGGEFEILSHTEAVDKCVELSIKLKEKDKHIAAIEEQLDEAQELAMQVFESNDPWPNDEIGKITMKESCDLNAILGARLKKDGESPPKKEGEVQTCPKRMVEWGPWERKEELDAWVKRGSDRVCSFCGSLHPEELLKICKQVNGLKIFLERKGSRGPTQKIYVNRPDIANASEGAIKFYTIHIRSLSEDQWENATRTIEKALILSQAYEQERLEETREMIKQIQEEKKEEELQEISDGIQGMGKVEEDTESEEERIIKIVQSHRRPDGSFSLMDAVNEIRRTFPILGLKGSKEAMDKAKTEIWIREESLLKTTQKEEEKPLIIQKGKCTTCDYAKKNPTTILVRTEDWDILWQRQGDYCKFCMNDVLMAQLMSGFFKVSGIPEEELIEREGK